MTDNQHVLVPEAGAARSTLIVFGVLTVIGGFSFPALYELSFIAYGSAWTIVGLLCIIAGLFAKRINDSIEALAINHEKNLVRQRKLQEYQVHPGIPRKVELIIFIVVSILLAGLVERSIYLTGMTTFVMYSIMKVLMVIKKMPRLEVLRIVTIYVLWNVGLGINAVALPAIGR
ncbi:MAG TPA: hypothetical protein VJ044_08320, partial [Candidatus Hodarchaeales archaeon]|nr:hypothetical protein [Candidatus Hodarchaeales archaeon]